MGLTPMQAEHLIYLILHPEIMKLEEDELKKVTSPLNRASRFITIIGSILYAVIRMVLLVLAFAALRSVPQGVYTTTWTRFLPNIS